MGHVELEERGRGEKKKLNGTSQGRKIADLQKPFLNVLPKKSDA